jgi:hypothetical protein
MYKNLFELDIRIQERKTNEKSLIPTQHLDDFIEVIFFVRMKKHGLRA